MMSKWKKCLSLLLSFSVLLFLPFSLPNAGCAKAHAESRDIVLEAENATLSGSYEINSDSNASGGKYVRTAKDTYIEFRIPTSGTYHCSVRVKYPFGQKENYVNLNGKWIQTIKGSNSSWEDVDLGQKTLSAGDKIQISMGWGYFDVDSLVLSGTGNPNPTSTVLEAENSTLSGSYEISSDSNASGGKYVRTAKDTYIEFCVPASGTYQCSVRVKYPFGQKENYVNLNGRWIQTIKGSNSSWEDVDLGQKTLSAGDKIQISMGWGYFDVDCLKLDKSPDKPAGGMYVSGTTLYDANGNPFVMRGINIPYVWFPQYFNTGMDAIGETGTNCVRVVLADGQKWTKTDAESLRQVIDNCRSHKMICVLELQDTVMEDDIDKLMKAVDYWIEMKDILNANKDCVVVNIACEWGKAWESNNWCNGNVQAVHRLRNAGIQNVLMVDCAGCGQFPQSLFDRGKDVKAADWTGNIMFSIHMYEYAGKAGAVKPNIDGSLNQGLCTVIGEFSDTHDGGDVDEQTIMSYCTYRNVGYLGWL